jgi:hypothetical protein
MQAQPDKGIKNVIIKQELLGKVSSGNSRIVRFRIVSEDKNRKSAYSKIFITNSDAVLVAPGDVNAVGNTIFVNWSTGQISTQTTYDIFAGFDGAVPSYVGTSGSQNYSFLKNGTQNVRVIVQIASINRTLVTDLTLFKSVRVYDSGIRNLPTPTP